VIGDAGTLLLRRCTFPPAGSALTCAVSGGPDSLALLALASLAGCRVRAVHVDHGLREGSAAEAGLVAQAAERLGAGFRAERVHVEPGPNLEARARAARFAVLPPDVATGHTMDDQAETVLCNLLRGSGLDGLAGMKAGPRHPLLGIRRFEARALCEESGLRWAEDPSNEDARFLRNRVRHELLPMCADVAGRDPVPLLARLAALAASDAELLDALASEVVPDPSVAADLARAPAPLAGRAVRRWLRALGATPDAGGRPSVARGPDRHPPSLAEVRRVLAVASGAAVSTELAGGWRVRRSKGRLIAAAPEQAPPGAPGAPGAPRRPAAQGARTKVSPMQVPTQMPMQGREPDGTVQAPSWARPAVGRLIVSADEIAAKVAELGKRITEDFRNDPPLLVGVLKGAMLFMSDLCRAIELPVDVDFMAVSSYGSATQSSGVVRIVKDLDAELTGRRVIVVEDIIDSGLTLNYLRRYLHARRPETVDVCALLVKEGEQRVDLDLRYVGFTIPSEFVVGYGLDAAERYRNLAGVHAFDAGAEHAG
jgi:hypoxanthine phosphoribosyltransferase